MINRCPQWRHYKSELISERERRRTVAARLRGTVVDVEFTRDAGEALETRAPVARLVGGGGGRSQTGQDRRADAAVKTRIVLYTHTRT